MGEYSQAVPMVDKVRLEVPGFSLPKVDNHTKHVVTYAGLEFSPASAYYTDGTCFTKEFYCWLENLKLRFIPQKKLFVLEGSLHHYRNRCIGNPVGNSDDFGLTEVERTLRELSERLNINLDNAIVRELECGVNIAVNALGAYCSLFSYRGKKYEPMQAKGQIYGSCCRLDKVRVKAYDKRLQLKLQKGINIDSDAFRLELAVTNASWFNDRKDGIPITMGRDLCSYESMQFMVHELCEKFKNSVKRANIDLSRLRIRELSAVARMEHARVHAAMKQFNKRSYKEDSRIYSRLLDKNADQTGSDELLKLIKQKAVDLLHA